MTALPCPAFAAPGAGPRRHGGTGAAPPYGAVLAQ